MPKGVAQGWLTSPGSLRGACPGCTRSAPGVLGGTCQPGGRGKEVVRGSSGGPWGKPREAPRQGSPFLEWSPETPASPPTVPFSFHPWSLRELGAGDPGDRCYRPVQPFLLQAGELRAAEAQGRRAGAAGASWGARLSRGAPHRVGAAGCWANRAEGGKGTVGAGCGAARVL